MKRRFALITAIVLLAPATVWSQSAASGLDKIAVYAGDWTTTIVHNKTIYSRPRVETTHLHNECWRSADYYACHQYVDGTSVALVIFTYDAKRGSYKTYNVPPDGSDGGSGPLLINDDTWTFPWTIHDGGKVVYFRVVNTFHGQDVIQYQQEFSSDKLHWTVTATGNERRVLPSTIGS